jgi:hypothetical protein
MTDPQTIASKLTKVPFVAVCSARPRASTQSMKGNQWWRREPYHLLGEGGRTLCGRNCTEWLTIGPMPEIDDGCCIRCSLRTHLEKESKK